MSNELNTDDGFCGAKHRREFVFGCVAFGLLSLFGPKAFAQIYKEDELGIPPYNGPLLDVLHRLTLLSDAGKISHLEFITEVGKRLQEVKHKVEFKPWIDAQPSDQDRVHLYNSSRSERKPQLALNFIKPNSSVPPHAHHSLSSIQIVIDGNLHVREYDRVKAFADNVIGIRKTADRMLAPGESFDMTDFHNNVHWFGSEGEPAILLNFNIDMQAGKSFYPRESREREPIFVDPTEGKFREGLIVANEIHGEEAMDAHMQKFGNKPLSFFS